MKKKSGRKDSSSRKRLLSEQQAVDETIPVKGIGCCAPATKCFWPDVIHSAGSAQDIANCWVWGSSGIPPGTTPLKSSEYTLGSSWNLTAAKTTTTKNLDQQIISLLHSRDGILLLLLLFGLGERKQCRQQRLVSTPVCDKGISETPASSGAGIKRGTSSSSSPQQQLVPRRGVDTHSQAAVAARNYSLDNCFSFTNSTNKAASPRPSRPTCSHTLLDIFFLIFVHMCQCV